VNEPAIAHEAFTDEVVLINLETGNYYSTAQVGAEIWALIAAGANVAAIEQHVAREHTGSRDVIHASVDAFLQTLVRENLIVPAAEPAADAIPAIRTGPPTPFKPPELQRYSDMQELLALDPVHDVDETGWPARLPAPEPRKD
jgi:hypothetical protein